jgi:hypothetical protein
MLTLHFVQLPQLAGPEGDGYHGLMPRRALLMAPEAAQALLGLERETGGLVYTDIFRSPDATLAAIRSKAGTMPPGYSGHGFGESVDADVLSCLRRLHCSYPAFTDVMARHGYYCHRRDLDATGAESWHFNYFGPDAQRLLSLADVSDHRTWSAPLERLLFEKYGASFVLGPREAQAALTTLCLYHGEIDGDLGRLSREALSAFQRAWGVPDDGALTVRTQRTLAYVTAVREIGQLPPPAVV